MVQNDNLKKKKSSKKRIIKLKSLIYGMVLITFVLCTFIYFFFIHEAKDIKKSKINVSETLAPVEIVIPEVRSASILSAGDIILHSPFISSSVYRNSDGSYDYTSMFRYIKDDYQSADFTVINFESTISSSNYSGYPTFRSPEAIAEAIKLSNVDLCLLANNHIYDNSDQGLYMTMDSLEQNSLLYTGTRKSVSDKTYFIQDVNGIKVGIFNYVYETGSIGGQKFINGSPVSNESGKLINTFHYYNLDAFYNEIQQGLREMQTEGVEYTIAYLHWGNEYQTQESSYQRTIAKQLCELGIDALIGGHPHVIQPVDLLTNDAGNHQMVCVYSMGNHISNQRQELMSSMPYGHTEDGLMVKLTLSQTGNGPVSLVQAAFIPTWVYKTLENGGAEYYVLPLDDPEQIIQEAYELNIASDIEKSLDRTNEIIGFGVKKIQDSLPITNTY